MKLCALVLGCGSIGRRHIANLRMLGVSDVAAFDVDTGRLAAAERELGVRGVPSMEAGLSEGPQAVLVCPPPAVHVTSTLAGLEAGAAVLVEKPIAPCGGPELDRLLGHRYCRRVLVGYNLRFHKGLATVAELLHTGMVGRPLSIFVEFGHYLPEWRPDEDYRTGYIVRRNGGILLDASHEIDYVQWLAGEVESVSAVLAKTSDLEMEAEDTALLTLRHRGGVLSQVHLDCVQRGYTRGCKVVGTEATLVWGLRDGVRLTRDGKTWLERPVVPDANDMYVEELRHFLDVVVGRAEPLVDVGRAAAVLAVIEAAKRSAEERREVAP